MARVGALAAVTMHREMVQKAISEAGGRGARLHNKISDPNGNSAGGFDAGFLIAFDRPVDFDELLTLAGHWG